MEIKKNNVIIPIEIWNELKQIDYFKEIIEVLEDSKELEKAMAKTKSFINLEDYISERTLKEKVRKSKRALSNKGKKSYV